MVKATEAATQNRPAPVLPALASKPFDETGHPDADGQLCPDAEHQPDSASSDAYGAQKRLPGLFKKVSLNAPLADHVGAALQLLLKFAEDGHGLDELERSSVFTAVRRRLDPGLVQDEEGWTIAFWASYLAKADSGLKKSTLDRFLCLVGFHQSFPDQKTANNKFKTRFESEFFHLPQDEKSKLRHKFSTRNGWGEKPLRLIQAYGMGILLTPNI